MSQGALDKPENGSASSMVKASNFNSNEEPISQAKEQLTTVATTYQTVAVFEKIPLGESESPSSNGSEVPKTSQDELPTHRMSTLRLSVILSSIWVC